MKRIRLVAREAEVAGGVSGGKMDGRVDSQIVPRAIDIFGAEEVEAVRGPGEADAG